MHWRGSNLDNNKYKQCKAILPYSLARETGVSYKIKNPNHLIINPMIHNHFILNRNERMYSNIFNFGLYIYTYYYDIKKILFIHLF